MMKNLKKKKGFTLIELIIVIAILGILAAIAIPKFGDVQKSSRIKADIATAKTIADTTAMLIANEDIKPATEDGEAVVKKSADTDIGSKVGNALQSVPDVQSVEGEFIVQISDAGVVTVYVNDDATKADLDEDNQIHPRPEDVDANPFYN